MEQVRAPKSSEREGADGACEALFSWAVDHYETVHAQIDAWLTAPSPAALPPAPRMLGQPALRGFAEVLRSAMLKRRHGL